MDLQTGTPIASAAPSSDERTMAVLTHLSPLTGFIFPFGHIIAPLVIWLLKKDTMPFIATQGREVINFQISLTLYGIVFGLLVLIVIGIPLLIALLGFQIVMMIVAALKASRGEPYRYPLTIRFLK